MIKYKKTYKDYFEIGEQDKPLCEICKCLAVDIHHISAKKSGGSKNKDFIENLIGLCRECHNKAHAHKISVETLVLAHKYRMIETGKLIDYNKFKTILK